MKAKTPAVEGPQTEGKRNHGAGPDSGTPSGNSTYFLGFDGGGTKTDCVLLDGAGQILARAQGGPSNPLRAGFTKAWFALSETADVVLRRQKIRADDITGVCAGLGGASRTGVVNQVTGFLKRSFPSAQVKVVTDLEIGLQAAFGAQPGILLIAGTGSAAFGRDAEGRTARAGGRGPWFSDEGSAFEIGRAALHAVVLAEDGRGPATELSSRIFSWNQAANWDGLIDQAAKDADALFPKTFPLVAQLADRGDAICREILAAAANSLASLAAAVARELNWHEHDIPIAKLGGVYGRSSYFDGKIDAAVAKALPRAHFVPLEISPAEAAARMSMKLAETQNHAA